MEKHELQKLIRRAALGCLLAVTAIAACLLPLLEKGTVTPTPEPTAAVTSTPAAEPTPTSAASPSPPPTTEPKPTLAGGPLPAPSVPPQEDLSSRNLPLGSLVNPYVTYSYEQMNEDIIQLEAKYPNLITSYSIGKTVEGRDITAFNFGRGKREVILCASMHACENISTNFLMYMADQYCMGYKEDKTFNGMSYRELLDNVKFLVVPMVNPDGINISQKGPDSALNPAAVRAIGGSNYNYASWKANINGVDLNGNFKGKWGIREEITAPAPEGYAGPSPASEPETQAMIKLMDSSDFYLLVSLHIRGEVLYWLDTDTLNLYNKYYPIASRFAKAFNFELLEPEDVTKKGGYMVNSARIQYGKFCMTVEMCPYISVDPYPLYLFNRSATPVYPLGLLMGKETMAMDKLSTAADVILNDKVLVFYPQRPVMKNDCVSAPAFDLLSKCGAVWEWWEPKGVLKVSYGGNNLELKLNSDTMKVNGAEVTLDEPMSFEGSTLMIPVCQVLRSLHMNVQWDSQNCNVIVKNQ